MKLTEHFTLDEFTESDTAARAGIDNSVPPDLMDNAVATAELLERIRSYLSDHAGHTVRINLTSGYRCLAVNRLVGSSDTSDHVEALAADFKSPDFGTPYEICCALAPVVSELGIGQLIHEFGRWVHVSTRRPVKQVNRIITITARGTEVGIQQA